MKTIETTRLILRPFIQDDRPKVFEGLSHPDVIKHYGISYDSLEKTQEQMDWFQSIEEKKTGLWRAILRKEDKEFLGAIGINNRQIKHQCAELGCWFLPQFWKQGYAKEAGIAFCEYLFHDENLHRIEALIETENQASLATIQALGFQHEGTRRECEKNGEKWISLALFGKLNSHH